MIDGRSESIYYFFSYFSGALPDFFPPFFFPCSADHERDWPPCKKNVFLGLAINALNVRNNNNNKQQSHL